MRHRLVNGVAALSLALCLLSLLAQRGGHGVPLIGSTHDGSYSQQDHVYGLIIGHYAVPFAYICLPTAVLPCLWGVFWATGYALRWRRRMGA